jgi:queuosine precursor transporter
MRLDARQTLFLYLVGVFITCLLVGDIIGGKLSQISVFGWDLPISVGMIPFPITFVLTDIVNEFYGKQVARKLTMLGLCMVGLTFAIIYAAAAVPWAPFTSGPDWQGMQQGAFTNVFVSATRIQLASMVAFFFSQFIDIGVFFLIKRLTGSRYLWLRATGSTAVSQLIDTVVIQTLAWYGLMSNGQIAGIVVASYTVKLVAAVAMTPVIYGMHLFIERLFDIKPVAIAPDSHGGHESSDPATPGGSSAL